MTLLSLIQISREDNTRFCLADDFLLVNDLLIKHQHPAYRILLGLICILH